MRAVRALQRESMREQRTVCSHARRRDGRGSLQDWAVVRACLRGRDCGAQVVIMFLRRETCCCWFCVCPWRRTAVGLLTSVRAVYRSVLCVRVLSMEHLEHGTTGWLRPVIQSEVKRPTGLS
jgi:hypothetical protein